MRDKLIEIARDFCRYEKCLGKKNIENCKSCENGSKLADHLIANNVFVLPEKMKDSWGLALPFLMRLFATDEEQIEKVHREFERKEVKKILTDIRDYLVAKAELVREMNMEFLGKSAMLQLLAIEEKKLKEYAEKLGVEL